MTYAETLAQAVGLATARAERTGVRQRVEVCPCDRAVPHFTVNPVDRVPASVFA